MSYVILRGRWCDIVLNVHAPTEDKIDDMKDRFYEELEHMFDKFPKYHMKILLGDFSAKVGREDILKPTTENEILHDRGMGFRISVGSGIFSPPRLPYRFWGPPSLLSNG
jgi:hypothetical protein